MSVEVSLFGFGDERPSAFGANNELALPVGSDTTIEKALNQAGVTEPESLSAILNGTMVPRPDWSTTLLADGDKLKLLMAIEGG